MVLATMTDSSEKTDFEALEEKFRTKVEIAHDSLKFLEGDRVATNAEINQRIIEMGELKRKMLILKSVVEKLNSQTKQAEALSKCLGERIASYDQINANLPKRLVKDEAAPTKTEGKMDSQAENKEAKKSAQQPAKIVPKVRYLGLDDFDKIPKYMRGRLSYDALNQSIEEFNNAVETRYNFLAKGFQAMASVAQKKKYKEMKSQETRDTRGVYFVVADDLKTSETLKSESARRNIFAILRHFQLIREIRGPGSIVRFAVNPA